ncbi:MAG: 3-hydroxyisobutyrate dehydrogenase [Actinobacteria bacterium]|uniref:Unannotated protein n=1 Tax=freshwater metagenome TaxID=449393 RepID=A0A6J6QF85_9ZZZZ|nr:3-hydroxyisobutyrate dehydrogenase [Actinomycetota bacterium]
MTDTRPIAFIGLGNMGGPMAANLVRAGYPVTGFDPVPAAAETAAGRGITVVGSAAEAVASAQVVITMLPSGQHVLDVYAEVLDATPAGALFIDCSTIAVDDARAAAARAVAAGHRAVDAPVSGGVVGAEAGTLTMMLGAADAEVADATVVLEPVSGRVVHCGEVGSGQAAKICNNMILAASMIVVSEAFVLGERLGLTHQALFEVASTASGQCWALTTNCPVPGPVPASPANRDYQPGFASQLMVKDLSLAMRAAESTGTDTRVGALAAAIYEQYDEGRGRDFSSVIHDIRDRSEG